MLGHLKYTSASVNDELLLLWVVFFSGVSVLPCYAALNCSFSIRTLSLLCDLYILDVNKICHFKIFLIFPA